MRRQRALGFLSHFAPWVVIAYFGLVLIGFLGLRLNGQAVKRQTLSQTAVRQCLASRKPLRDFKKHVEGVDEFAVRLIDLNAYRIAHMNPADPEYGPLRDKLAQAVRAREKIAAFNTIHVPTVEECEERG